MFTPLLCFQPTHQHALELFGYQHLITSANLHLPFSAWMSYDTKFRTLAANYPSLHWDVHHLDLWLECMTIPKPVTPDHWPCPYCNSICDRICENLPYGHILHTVLLFTITT